MNEEDTLDLQTQVDAALSAANRGRFRHAVACLKAAIAIVQEAAKKPTYDDGHEIGKIRITDGRP